MGRLRRFVSPSRNLLAAGKWWLISAACLAPVQADSSSWNLNNGGSWNAAGNWNNGIPGSTAGTTSTDVATFGAVPLTADRTVTVDSNRNIGGISFANESAFRFTLNGGSLWLTDGAVVQTLATNGNHTDTIGSTIVIQGDNGSATFTAGATSSSSLLSVTGGITGVSTAGNTTTLNLNGTNTGANLVSGIIGNGAGGGNLAVVKSGTGNWNLSAANTFTGGLTIQSGTVTATSNTAALGAGTVTLGNTTVTDSASLVTTTNNITYGNAIILATNASSGPLSIVNGGVTTSNATFSGGITGTNHLVISNNAGTTGLMTFSGLINHGGTLTSNGTSTGNTVLSGGIGSNVTGIIQNSGTSALNLTGALTVNSTGTTLTNSSGIRLLTASGGTGGTGNLVLRNDSATTSGITLSGTTVNHTGTLTNSGSGDGNTLISAVIGANVTGVIQDSATSALTLNGTNTFSSGLTVKKGTVQLGNAAGAGTGAITLGDVSGTAAANLMLTSASTFTNSLVLGSGGTLALINNTSNNSTYSGGITGNNNLAINNNNTGGGALSVSGLINNTGAIMVAGTSAQNTLLTGGIGANVTGITQNSSTSALTVSTTALNVNSGGTTLVNNSGRIFTVSSGIVGTGNLLIQNNSSLASGITISGAVNHSGSITNSGIGITSPAVFGTTNLSLDRNVLISGAIGSTVTTVTQNSATSVMELSSANTFSDSARVWDGALILGNATSAGASQILVGNTSGSGNASLLLRQVAIANNVLVQAGNSGTTTLGAAASGGNSTFSGTITLNKDVTLSPYNNGLVFTGLITGAGGITASSIGSVTSSSGQSYGIGGGSVTLSKADLTNTFSGDTTVLSGMLTLTGTATTNANLTGLLGTSTNSIVIGDTSGSNSARLLLNAGAVGQTFSRNLVFRSGSGGAVGVGVASSNGGSFSGSLTLDRSIYLFNGNSGAPTITYSGAVTLGSSALGGTSVVGAGGNLVKLTNTANNYDGGTLAGGVGTVWGEGAGALGTGNAVAEMGFIRLSDQVALASGRKVYVGPYGGVSIGTNTAAQIAYIASVLEATSSGAVTLGTGVSNTINLSAFGNGYMYLGTDVVGANYSAASLGANLDGNYRLGWGRQTLTITTGALTGASASVTVGMSGGLTGVAGSAMNTIGTVSLAATNTYGGGTVVNTGSTLNGTQRLVAGESPFGSSTGSMTLHNATLRLQNNGTSTIGTSVGALAFDGASTIQIDGTSGGANTLTVGAITRTNNGILAITSSGGTLGSTAFLKTSGPAPATTAVLGGTVQMVAPYIIDGSNGNFMSWDATNGFTPITTAVDTTNFIGLPTNAVTKITANATLSADASIYALGIRPVATNTILGSGGDRTLTILSGGIYQDGRAGSYSTTIGSSTDGLRVNLDFNNQEAIINVYTSNNSALTIANNIVNATGLTKAGNGGLVLSGTGSTFVGPITILGTTGNSYLSINNDLNLGGVGDALNNGVVLDGGKLTFANAMTMSGTRSLTVGANGATLSTVNSGNYGSNAIVIDSKITGNNGGFLAINAGTTGAGSNTTANTFRFTNVANDFVAPIYIGGVNQVTLTTLVFDNDAQLGHASNAVNLMGGNAALRYAGTGSITSSRAINFYDLGGGIDLASATGVWTHSGVIGGSGVFNKMGLGTLTLTGNNTYTGNTIVGAGVLNIQHANALGATTAIITGSNGVSGGGVYVQEGAALEVQGGLVIGGSGGKTTYLNGSGIGNAGALRNVSGNNSNAGALVLQSASTIGSDAGRYTVSGVVSGEALTKVGAGALEFSAANTYVGGTVVSGGTLIVNNTTGSATGSGTVALGAGTTLGGAGSISGLVTTADLTTVIAPGNSPGTLTVGSLDASAGTSFSFELGAVSDLLVVTGAFTGSSFASGLSFSFADAGGLAAGNPYTLITFGSSSGLDYSDLVASVVPSGYELDLAFGTNGFLIDSSSLQVQFSAIPEPGMVSLIGLGLITLTIFRRRRQG